MAVDTWKNVKKRRMFCFILCKIPMETFNPCLTVLATWVKKGGSCKPFCKEKKFVRILVSNAKIPKIGGGINLPVASMYHIFTCTDPIKKSHHSSIGKKRQSGWMEYLHLGILCRQVSVGWSTGWTCFQLNIFWGREMGDVKIWTYFLGFRSELREIKKMVGPEKKSES